MAFKDRETHLAYFRRYRASRAQELRELIDAYLAGHPCVDCGEADPVVLEFDHRDPSQKKFCVSYAAARTYSPDTVRAEMGKCDVRCANCHRRKSVREARERFANSGVV